MESLAVDLQLLRSMMVGDLRLAVGRTLMARVANVEGNGRGTISLAGTLLDAELPKGLAIGQEIRLQVRELTADKVVLAMQDRPPILDQPVTMPMPGGGAVEIRERIEPDGGGGGGGGATGRHMLTLVYDAPSLGSVEMRFVLDPASLKLELVLGAGDAYDSAQDHSDELRQALAEAVKRTITVSLLPRREPIEIYA